MSVSGISEQTDIFALGKAFTSQNGVFAISIFILQCVMLGFSFWSYEIQENHFRTFNKIKLFQFAIVSVSIYCNYKYMLLLVPDNQIICGVFACAFDVGSIYFSELATVTKYRLYSSDNSLHNATLFEKLKVVLFGGWMDALDAKYQERISSRQKTSVNLDKQSVSGFENLLSKVIEKCQKLTADTVVNKDTFGLDVVTWQKARQELEKRGIVHCKNKKTYISSSLADIAREKIEERE